MSKIFYYLVSYKNIKACRTLLKLLGIELPKEVIMGNNITFPHLGGSIVIHQKTTIHYNVIIFQEVTIGRADPYNTMEQSKMEGIEIRKGAILSAGAKILCKSGVLTVGENTIIAANAVLLESTGNNEVWGGIPAKKIGDRKFPITK